MTFTTKATAAVQPDCRAKLTCCAALPPRSSDGTFAPDYQASPIKDPPA
ncbi:MAG: hypothetical protein HOP09_00740 [Hyphomicrobium sp.]|nr:hypothetical protein [Hyphomicrobium sp.]